MARVLYLQADSGKNSGQFLIDAKTRERPVISDGTSLTVRLGAFHFDVPADLANLTQLNFEFRKSTADDETPFLSKDATLPIANESILLSAWNSRSAWNAEIDFTSEELDYAIPDESEYVDLWLIVTATFTDGSQDTLGAGTVRISATNDSGVTTGAYMLKSVYDSDNDGIVDRAALADAVAWTNVTGKPTSFTPAAHTHVKADVTDLTDFAGAGANGLVPDPTAATGKILYDDGSWDVPTVAWANITGAPSDFLPGTHSHTKSEVTDLADFAGAGASNLVPDPTVENGYFLKDDGTWAAPTTFAGAGADGLVPDPVAATGQFLKDDGTWDDPSPAVAWGDVTGKPATFAPAAHTHAKADVTDLANFSGAGTDGLVPDPVASTGKYLKDDGSWDTPTTTGISDFAGAGANGLVPDPTVESGRFLKDDGSWSNEVDFSGAGTNGLVPDPTTATGKYLKDDGTWDTPSAATGGTPVDMVVFEVIPPNVAVTSGTHYVTRWAEQFDCTEVIFTFEENGDHVYLNPALSGTNLLNSVLWAQPTDTRVRSADMNNTSFSGGAANTARMAENTPLTVNISSVGGYGTVEGLWIWLIGEWNFNQ